MSNVQATGAAFGNAYGAGYAQGLQDGQGSTPSSETPAVAPLKTPPPKPPAPKPAPAPHAVSAPSVVVLRPVQHVPPVRRESSDGQIIAILTLGAVGTAAASAGLYLLGHVIARHVREANTRAAKALQFVPVQNARKAFDQQLLVRMAARDPHMGLASDTHVFEIAGNLQERQVGGLGFMHASNSMLNSIELRAKPQEFRQEQVTRRPGYAFGEPHNDFSSLAEGVQIYNARVAKLQANRKIVSGSANARKLEGLAIEVGAGERVGDHTSLVGYTDGSGMQPAMGPVRLQDFFEHTDRMMVMVSDSAETAKTRGHWVTLAHSNDGFWRVIDSKAATDRAARSQLQPRILHNGNLVHSTRPTAHDAERALRGYLQSQPSSSTGQRHVSLAIPRAAVR